MPSAEDLRGRTLGEFVVREKLGEGGAGVVYLAEQPLLAREAVVKVLASSTREDASATQRFLREARLASKLDHPYAAHVYAFGAEADGLLWIAMELVRGTPLNQLILEQGPIPLHRALPLLERICEVVHSAHEQGIVHRDIKPANVMVMSRAGRLLPKLLDFGIAKLRGSDEPALPAYNVNPKSDDPETIVTDPSGAVAHAVTLDLTSSGSFVGSPHYMAPEQWVDSATVDGRADIYSLGVLCFQTLTGAPPFTALNIQGLIRHHARTAPPPLPAGLPLELNAVIAKSLAKLPQDRYATAGELSAALLAAAAPADQPLQIPQLEESIREAVVTDAPQPLAEAVTLLEAARTARGAMDGLEQVTRVAARYLGLVALAARIRSGSGTRVDSVEVTQSLKQLRRDRLTPLQWVDLARALCNGFADKRDVHPMPELVSFFFDASDRSGPPRSTGFDELVAMLEGAALERDEAKLAPLLTRGLEQVGALLRSLSFLLDYPLLVAREGAAERWMGPRRMRRACVTLREKVEDGSVILVDASNEPLLRLSPLIQAMAPSPGSMEELFFLEGRGRHGAKLTALPLGFERHDEGFWDGFARHFPETEASSGIHEAEDRAPFRGLAAFTSADAESFFGREQEAEAFANRLRTQGLLAVVGPSGVGKSSFIQAGVLPLLPSQWLTVTVRPGPTPVTALLGALRESSVRVTGLKQALAISSLAFRERLLQNLGARSLLIVVDQFEEVLTLAHDAQERGCYCELLSVLGRDVAGNLRVVLTLRDDFLIRVQQLPALKERIAQGLQLLSTPQREDLVRILTEPVARMGYGFEDPRLPLEMAEGLVDEPGALALLSFTATKLWDLRDRHFKSLSRKAYEALGGVGGALAHHAEETLASMTAQEQLRVREAFRHLVSSEGTRAVLSRTELGQLLGTGDEAEGVLEKLISARLLVVSEGQGGFDRVEVIHETLLSSWPRLVRWQREDAEGARMRDQLRAAARQWEERGRPGGVLWRGDALTEYRLWRARYPGALTDAEEAFARLSNGEELRGKRIFSALLVGTMALLVLGVLVLYRANGRAERSAAEARARLALLHEEHGRLSYLQGKPLQALVFLAKAHEEGISSAGNAYLIARASDVLGAQQLTLAGHSLKLYTATFSADGSTVATASADRTARLWDAHTGELRATLTGHGGNVYGARFSPDGKTVATACEDSVARLFRTSDGSLLRALRGHRGPVLVAEFSPDGRLLATGSTDRTLRLWDVESGALIATGPEGPGALGAVQFSPDGRLVATAVGWFLQDASPDNSVALWSVPGAHLVRRWKAHDRPVATAFFSPDGKLLLTASADRTAKVTDVSTGALLHTLSGHSGPVRVAVFSPDGARIASAGDDRTVRLWNSRTGALIIPMQGHDAPIHALAFSRDGSRLASGGDDAQAILWDARSGQRRIRFAGHLDALRSLAFSPDGRQLLTSSLDRTARLWDATRTEQLTAFVAGAQTAWGEFSGDGLRVFTGGDSGRFNAWDSQTGRLLGTHALPGAAPEFPVWTRDGSQVWLTAAADGKVIQLWDFLSDKHVLSLRGHPKDVQVIRIVADGEQLLSAGVDGTVILWSVKTQTPIRTWHLSDAVQAATLSPDGESLVVGFRTDPRVRIYSVRNGALLRTLEGHQLGVFSAEFTRDGKRLLTAGGEQTLRIWDVETGAPLKMLLGHSGVVNTAVFNSDGELIVSASMDGSAKVWDAATGELLENLELGEPVMAAGFSPDGQRLLTVGSEGRVELWRASLDSRDPKQLEERLRCQVPFTLRNEQLETATLPGCLPHG